MRKFFILVMTASAITAISLCSGCGGGTESQRADYLLNYTRSGQTPAAPDQLTIMPDGRFRLVQADTQTTEGQLPPEFWEQLRIWQTEIPSFNHNSPPAADATAVADTGRESLHWSSTATGAVEADRPQRMLEWTREMLSDLAETRAEE